KTLVFAPTARDALLMIAIYNVDCLVASPLHLRQLLDERASQPGALPSLRLIFTGGALPTRALLDEARAWLCRHIIVQYGSTEAGATAFGPAESMIADAGAHGADAFAGGWFYPGDRGHVTADGTMIVAGRIAEILVTGGQALAPEA